MSEQAEVVDGEVTDAQADEQALASAMDGYKGKARGVEPPADATSVDAQAQEDAPATPAAEAAPEAPAEPTLTDLAAELNTLKAKVKETTGDPDALRKMHGEIGNINRTLQQLQKPAQPDDAPADDELAAALKDAEAVAEEFPELAGPLVKMLKASLKKSQAQPQGQAEPVDVAEAVKTAVAKHREQDAMEALREEHPDYETVREKPEYKAWLASKTPEFQHRFNTTWNPAVVAKGLSEFKESLIARQRNNNRLEQATTPQGVAQAPRPSKLPDEEGLNVGYYGKAGNRR